MIGKPVHGVCVGQGVFFLRALKYGKRGAREEGHPLAHCQQPGFDERHKMIVIGNL